MDTIETQHEKLPVHVAFFTGYIPPYALPVLEEINRRIEKLTVLVSTKMESNRQWQVEFGELDVRVQRTLTHFSKWKHAVGFSDKKETHIPWDTYWQIRNLQPDVVVSEELGYRSLMCGLYQFFRGKPPLLLVSNLSEHTEQGRGRLRLALRKWLSRRASATTANGVSGLRYLESIGFPKDRLFLFPYCMYPGGFETLPLERTEQESRRLIYVGELSERKGIDIFLEHLLAWCRENREQQVHLQLFGTGSLEPSLRALACPENLQLEFRGHRNYDEVQAGLQHSGILVFPTLADEWGLVVNEALAAGLPVLGSQYSQAVEELVQPGKNGWVYDPKQPGLEDLLTQVFRMPTETLNAMRPACRASVAERTPQWCADKFLHALNAVYRSK